MTKCEYCQEEKPHLIVLRNDFETIKNESIYFTKIFETQIVCIECFVFDVTDGEKQIED